MNHAQEAKRLVSATNTKDWNDPSPYVDRRIAAAHVHATLALAEQQRIANVIAWTTANGTEPTEETACKIAEALGLGDPE